MIIYKANHHYFDQYQRRYQKIKHRTKVGSNSDSDLGLDLKIKEIIHIKVLLKNL